MAHMLESMAFVNELPWHGLGSQLPEHQTIDVWLSAAGMQWNIESTDVMYSVNTSNGLLLRSNPDTKVLYRSDTLAPLSVVSKRYKVVQPREVLEFYRDLVSAGGFELETAGVLKGGRKLWALAKTGAETLLKGDDKVKAYLLLATSCDGSLCTTAQFTSVRVVCNNTLQIATANSEHAVKVPHSKVFDPKEVRNALGLESHGWDHFIGNIKALADRPVSPEEARQYMEELLGVSYDQGSETNQPKALGFVESLFNGQGKGASLDSARNTAWGLLNAVTEYVDHYRRARSNDYRLDSAWFGIGAGIKEKAYQQAITLLE